VITNNGIRHHFIPGKARLRETIREASEQDADTIGKAITNACAAWRGDRDQEDEIRWWW